MAPATTSRARGFSDASSSPTGLGVPDAPGPSPSMATTASITDSRGAASAHRSSSMWANCSLLWNRVWHPALARPGIRPKVFFTAPVIIMNMWVFSLHRLRMPSA